MRLLIALSLFSLSLSSFANEEGISCDRSPGYANSYVIALSWQPAFCETYGEKAGKPECQHLSFNSYPASHLVLHGLWPNQDGCGEHYGYCGVQVRKNHCDYPPLILNDAVAETLRVVMPSFAFGGCLERHEWNKHGSCQFLSSDDYFSLAMRLTAEVDQTPLGNYLQEHRGEKVTRTELHKMIQKSFGDEALHKVYLGCKNGFLVEILVNLPALILEKEPLILLVKKAPDFKKPEGCPRVVEISHWQAE